MDVLERISDSFRRKPVRTFALLFAAGVALVILREFALGFFDGLIGELTNGV